MESSGSQVFGVFDTADKGLEIVSECIGSSYIEGQLNPHSVRNCVLLQPVGGV